MQDKNLEPTMEVETKAPEDKNVEIKESRNVKRLKQRKDAILNDLITNFIEERSCAADPQGVYVDLLYAQYNHQWIAECKLFNKKGRRPFTMRPEAFKESVENILEKEKIAAEKKAAETVLRNFKHWYRRERVWKNRFWKALGYWIISKREKIPVEEVWKTFYMNEIIKI